MKNEVREPCPKCNTPHVRGKYELRTDGSNKVSPRDVQCCGIVWRWSVPIFKVSQSGYVLRILKDGETPFLKEESNGPATA